MINNAPCIQKKSSQYRGFGFYVFWLKVFFIQQNTKLHFKSFILEIKNLAVYTEVIPSKHKSEKDFGE